MTAASDTRLRGEALSSDGRAEARRGARARIALEGLTVIAAAAFLAASVVHFGFAIPLGFTTLSDATLLQAAMAEGAIGVAFVVAAVVVLARGSWAWGATLVAFLLGLVGVIIGLGVSAADPDLTSSANFLFHASIFPVVVVGLALALTRSGRIALRWATLREVSP